MVERFIKRLNLQLHTKMYKQSDLIGKIDPTLDDLVLSFNHNHFFDITSLRKGKRLAGDYGWIGEGYKKIFANQNIRHLMRTSEVHLKDITLTIDKDGVKGLEHVPEPERKVLEQILMTQYHRSNTLLTTVRNKDFERYDSIGSGAVKGLTFGLGIGTLLDALGLHGLGPELAARIFPGIYEAEGVNHVLRKNGTKEHGTKEHGSRIVRLVKNVGTGIYEVPLDIYRMTRNIPAGLYSAINFLGLVDKARKRTLPEKINRSLERILGINTYEVPTSTDSTEVLWAKEGNSAPYRGGGLLTLLRLYPIPVEGLHNVLESVAVTSINSGLNVQGGFAVYKNIFKKLPDKLSPTTRKSYDAFKKTMSDPFQATNVAACTLWAAGEVIMRSYGFRPEEYSNIAVALEAGLLGANTVAAALLAKQFVHYKVVEKPNYDISTLHLMQLARKYKSKKLETRLRTDIESPSKFVSYASSRMLFGSIDTVRYVAGKAVEDVNKGVEAIKKYTTRIINPQ